MTKEAKGRQLTDKELGVGGTLDLKAEVMSFLIWHRWSLRIPSVLSRSQIKISIGLYAIYGNWRSEEGPRP